MLRIICVFVASILVFATITNAEELNAFHILRDIKRKGPRCVIERFYGGSLKKSEPLENSISTGKAEWLEVVKLLRPASDAVESELLDYAVSMALPKNPLGVMTLLKSDPKNFTVDWICRDPYYEDTVDLATEKKFLKEAENALVHMYDPKQDKEIDALRWQCLEGIRRDLRAVEKDLDKTGVKEMPTTAPPSVMPPFPDR